MNPVTVMLIQSGLGFLLEAPVQIARPMTTTNGQMIVAWPFKIDMTHVRENGYVPHLLRQAANG